MSVQLIFVFICQSTNIVGRFVLYPVTSIARPISTVFSRLDAKRVYMRGLFEPAAKSASSRVSVCVRNVFYVTIIFTSAVALYAFTRIECFSTQSVGDFSILHINEIPSNNSAKEEEEEEETPRISLSKSSSFQDLLRRTIEETEEPWWERKNATKTLYIDLFTDLSNILQVMASAYTISYKENINMKIVFWGGGLRPARWRDLFSFPKVDYTATYPDGSTSLYTTKACPISDEVYVWKNTSDKIQWVKNKHGSGEIGCTKACCWREEPFPESVNWFYKSLRPTNEIQEKIDTFKRSQNWDKYQWIGVHVRRSDNFYVMKSFLETRLRGKLRQMINTTDGESMLPLVNYITLMKQLQKSWPKHELDDGPFYHVKPMKFFLATDNKDVRPQIVNEFQAGSIIWYNNDLFGTFGHRSIWEHKAAVIDLYLLASCQIIIGTPFSTFSEAASLIGGALLFEPEFAYYNMSKVT